MKPYKLILIFGGPASGKGTLSARLSKYNVFVPVSPGELVRAKADLDPEFANLMKQGLLLPTSFIGELTMNHIKTNVQPSLRNDDERQSAHLVVPSNKTILLDGFPRNEENLSHFLTTMRGFFDLVKVIVINCSDTLMEQRTLKRQQELNRSDDEITTFRRRLKYYHEVTEKILPLFDKEFGKDKIYHFQVDETAHDPYPDIIEKIIAINNSHIYCDE